MRDSYFLHFDVLQLVTPEPPEYVLHRLFPDDRRGNLAFFQPMQTFLSFLMSFLFVFVLLLVLGFLFVLVLVLILIFVLMNLLEKPSETVCVLRVGL